MAGMSWRRWLARWLRTRRSERRAHTVRTRLMLERLEDRLAPAASWTGPVSGGNWDTAANWSGGTGAGGLPGANDDVTIVNASVTHSTAVTDQIKSLGLTGATLNLSGGTLDVASTISTTNSTFRLSGGTLQHATVTAGSTITGSNFGGKLTNV